MKCNLCGLIFSRRRERIVCPGPRRGPQVPRRLCVLFGQGNRDGRQAHPVWRGVLTPGGGALHQPGPAPAALPGRTETEAWEHRRGHRQRRPRRHKGMQLLWTHSLTGWTSQSQQRPPATQDHSLLHKLAVYFVCFLIMQLSTFSFQNTKTLQRTCRFFQMTCNHIGRLNYCSLVVVVFFCLFYYLL